MTEVNHSNQLSDTERLNYERVIGRLAQASNIEKALLWIIVILVLVGTGAVIHDGYQQNHQNAAAIVRQDKELASLDTQAGQIKTLTQQNQTLSQENHDLNQQARDQSFCFAKAFAIYTQTHQPVYLSQIQSCNVTPVNGTGGTTGSTTNTSLSVAQPQSQPQLSVGQGQNQTLGNGGGTGNNGNGNGGDTKTCPTGQTGTPPNCKAAPVKTLICTLTLGLLGCK